MIWSPHIGEKRPCNPDLPVLIRMKCGAQSAQPRSAGTFEWTHRPGHGGNITHWRPA